MKQEKTIRTVPLAETIYRAAREDNDISFMRFDGGEVEEADLHGIAVENCIFTGCHFVDCSFEHSILSDVQFLGCDLSRCTFRDSGIHQTTFGGCRLLGADFVDTTLRGVKFEDCNGKYANFTGAQIKECSLTGSFCESVFSRAKFLKTTLEADFTRAEFVRSALGGVDFTRCKIDGAIFSLNGLTGVVVTHDQAAALAALLGLIIH